MNSWQPVIGLEVHAQLATRTKLFCRCLNRYGAPPNTLVCPVCLGLPGALPVPNQEAFRLGVRAALAFGCRLAEETRFDRKNYFYPDLPKGYQISQLEHPYAIGGVVCFEDETLGEQRVPLVRIHLEEDAGKSTHDPAHGHSRIDLNRCGTPLLEMVTAPALHSARAASECLRVIRNTLRWLGVSDGNMEEGSLRCDVNISLRPMGETRLGTRTEVKNLNSFLHVEQAATAEIARQQRLLASGVRIEQETRLFDEDRQETRTLRSKEEAEDYRYFPEPDLPRIALPAAFIEAERRALPELPLARRRRYRETLGLSAYDAGIVTAERAHADYFEAALAAGMSAKSACNWFQTEVLRELNERRLTLAELPLGAPDLARLVAEVEAGRIGAAAGREVLRGVAGGGDLETLLARAVPQVSDDRQLEAWITAVLTAHPEAVERIRAGNLKPVAFLVGQVMKLSAGAAHARRVQELVLARLAGAAG